MVTDLYLVQVNCTSPHLSHRCTSQQANPNVEIFYNLFVGSPKFIKFTPPDDTPKFLASRFLNYNTYFINLETSIICLYRFPALEI